MKNLIAVLLGLLLFFTWLIGVRVVGLLEAILEAVS